MVLEARRIAALTALFCPCAIPTPATPPPTVREHRLPRWINALLWRVGLPAADRALREAVARAADLDLLWLGVTMAVMIAALTLYLSMKGAQRK